MQGSVRAVVIRVLADAAGRCPRIKQQSRLRLLLICSAYFSDACGSTSPENSRS